MGLEKKELPQTALENRVQTGYCKAEEKKNYT